jgi:conjugative relaxase-like TrwC/TraI family protein
MLSISDPIQGRSAGSYYTALAADDYYTRDDAMRSAWLGTGALGLNLSGPVGAQQFATLLQGFDPHDESALVQNAGKPNRQCGWDLTFGAPKSVSVHWALTTPEEREKIEAAQRTAVASAIQFLEDECAFSRRGHGGLVYDRAKLVAAAFEHETSRELDPHLHTHVVLSNIVLRPDGSTGTLVSREFFRAKMMAGQLYRTELASQLNEKLGLPIYKTGKNSFELGHVHKSLCDAFSKRRQQIEANLPPDADAETKKRITLATRKAKEHVAREKLFAFWAAEAKGCGWQFDREQKQVEKILSPAEREEIARIANERRTHSITPKPKQALLHLLAAIAKRGGVVATVKEKRLFPKAPKWSAARRLTETKLYLGRYNPNEAHWTVTLVPGVIRIAVRERELFPKAPEWSPVAGLKVKSLRIERVPPPPPPPREKEQDIAPASP